MVWAFLFKVAVLLLCSGEMSGSLPVQHNSESQEVSSFLECFKQWCRRGGRADRKQPTNVCLVMLVQCSALQSGARLSETKCFPH